jgi:hypothetical protein
MAKQPEARFIPLTNSNLPGQDDNTPKTPSYDYRVMEPFWVMVETLLDGTPALRLAGELYLPKFPNESETDYDYRRRNSKYTNVYRDIVENLAAKPFAKELAIKDGSASQTIENLIEDIDGQGNHIHVFAAQVFFQAINDGVDWILVDKPPVPFNASVAVERQMGARPYWVHIPAKRMLAVYSDTVNGQETIINARIWEPIVERIGYKEVEIDQVRELIRDPLGNGQYADARYVLWRALQDQDVPGAKITWVEVERGPIALKIIALVPVITGRRKGGRWQFVPPMQDAAYLQIEHYQQETNLKSIKDQAAFPMLSGNGVDPILDELGNAKSVPVGPKTVLYAPRSSDGRPGSWTFIEPTASSLTFLAADVKSTEDQLRELGRQPLTAQTGNLTVVTTAFAAQKGNSAIQAWALNLKDALEQALKLTAQWLGDSSEPEVNVHTDFAIDLESPEAPTFLQFLRQNKDISRKAILDEAKRRDFLSPEYDPDKDQEEIDKEAPADPTPQDIQNALPPTPGGGPPPLRIVPQRGSQR